MYFKSQGRGISFKKTKITNQDRRIDEFYYSRLRISVHQSHDEESGKASHILAEVICNTYLKMHFYL